MISEYAKLQHCACDCFLIGFIARADTLVMETEECSPVLQRKPEAIPETETPMQHEGQAWDLTESLMRDTPVPEGTHHVSTHPNICFVPPYS